MHPAFLDLHKAAEKNMLETARDTQTKAARIETILELLFILLLFSG